MVNKLLVHAKHVFRSRTRRVIDVLLAPAVVTLIGGQYDRLQAEIAGFLLEAKA